MHQTKTLRSGLVALAVMLVSCSMAHATGAGIDDAAGFFSQEAMATAAPQIAAIQQKYGKDLRVETYATLPADRAAHYTPETRPAFFATWAYQRAKAVGLEGVMILLCKDPAFVQVEVGDRTQHQAFTLANRDHMRDLLVTVFRQKHFDDGLLQAVAYYATSLEANLREPGPGSRPSETPTPGVRPSMPAPQASPSSTPQGTRSLLWILAIIGGVGVCLWWLLRRRRGPGYDRGTPPNSGYAPYDSRGATPAGGYPPPGYQYGGGGGGFGRGFGGGILGGLLGGWLGNRLSQREPSSSPDASADPVPHTSGGGGSFDAPSGPDFSGDAPSDSGGGGDFGEDRGVTEEDRGGGSF